MHVDPVAFELFGRQYIGMAHASVPLSGYTLLWPIQKN